MREAISHAVPVEADNYAGMKRLPPSHWSRRCLMGIEIRAHTKRRSSRRRNCDLRTTYKRRGMLRVRRVVAVNPWFAKTC